CDAKAIAFDFTKSLPGLYLPNDAVDGLVRELVRRMGSAPIKKFHQPESNGLILLAGPVRVSIQASKEFRQAFARQRPFDFVYRGAFHQHSLLVRRCLDYDCREVGSNDPKDGLINRWVGMRVKSLLPLWIAFLLTERLRRSGSLLWRR